jgi:hypothetical protein
VRALFRSAAGRRKENRMAKPAPSGEFVVTQAELRDMMFEMAHSFGVLGVMRNVGMTPSDMTFWGECDYYWLPRTSNSTNGHYNLFHQFDSI